MRRLARTGLVAALAAAAATGLGAALAGAAGLDLDVDGGRIPPSGVAFVTAVLSLVGVVLAAVLLRWSARPARAFVRVALGLTTLSLIPPVLWADGAVVAVILVVLHLLAAGVVVPALVTALRSAAAPRSSQARVAA